MEKAIELEPEDPIVNDHYGDVLWKVGRKRESYFQWRRALLFEPDEELNSKIQEKLKEGLIDSFGN
jgi:predicted negative regulator of RcsB-dependent stress response